LLEQAGLPAEPDCLLLDTSGKDYWLWSALGDGCRPRVVLVPFNAAIDPGIRAAPAIDAGREDIVGCPAASFAALCDLATRQGYRLVHVQASRRLVFLRGDLELPSEHQASRPLTEAVFDGDTADSTTEANPPWFVTEAPWRIVAGPVPAQTVTVHDLKFEVLGDKADAGWYQQRKVFEERVSPLYRMLREEGFRNFVDVGANIGFISMIASRECPGIRIVSLEADPRLVELMRRNFAANGVRGATIVNAIVGSEPAGQRVLEPALVQADVVGHIRQDALHVAERALENV